MNQMIGSFKTAVPGVPEDFWLQFMKEANVEELTEMVVPIYDKYLTHDEVKELIKFYETPVGKKLVGVLPQITQESMMAGQQWGIKVGERELPGGFKNRDTSK